MTQQNDTFRPRQRQTQAGEYWKPKTKGETIVGKVSTIERNQYGVTVTFAPVLHSPTKPENEGSYRGYGSLSLGWSKLLSGYVPEDELHAGMILAVTYVESKASGKGNPTRIFRVADCTPQYFDKLVKVADFPETEPEPETAAALDEEDDDLPF